MLKILKKIKQKKKFIKNLYAFYKKYTIENYFLLNTNIYTIGLGNSLPKRQHILTVNTQMKSYIYSTGYILSVLNIKLKYYKRSLKANSSIILSLQRLFMSNIKHLYIYRCLNFNYRQLLFLQKFYKLISPKIFYFQHKKSYNVNYSPKKRIKKRIVKLLNK